MLVAPLRVAERFDDLTQAEISDMWSTVQKISKAIEKHYNCTSRTIAIQDGQDAGQTVMVSIHHRMIFKTLLINFYVV